MQLIAVAVSVSLAIGIPSAWATDTVRRCGRIGRLVSDAFLVAMVVAVAMPLILHAAAWEATAGKFGWLCLTQTGARSFEAFRGLVASGWIHAMVGSAITALATWYGTTRQSRAVVESAMLDFSPLRAWWTIRLPMAWPWILATVIINAAIASTEMTVVDLYGYRTIADEFYLFYAVNPNLHAILTTIALPLGLALGLGTLLLVSRNAPPTPQHDEMLVRGMGESPRPADAMIAVSILALAGLLIVAVPVLGLVVKIGHEVSVVDGSIETHWSLARGIRQLWVAPSVFGREYTWTLVLGGVTGVVSAALAWPLAAIGRSKPRTERCLDVTSVVVFCVPGPIVGLAVVGVFQWDLPGFRVLYEQTLLPTVIALAVRAVPIAYWVLRSGYRGIGDTVLSSSRLEFAVWRRLWLVDRPLMATSLVTAVVAAGLFASGDVPVTLPVSPPGVSTVGTRLFGLLHSGARYQEAALALWYLGVVACLAIVVGRSRKR
ncbi:ABC transporter permease [Novipirellula artificiosorum]|uniref:ABC transporter permease n=1 Tax=Novipirellula artificiosorum TaxID=2528016 RepID=UPI0011B75BBF|nr:hypothetical protein [Novipirellula artificiosorum]